ncbi:hypothetical protein GQ43DRAFT_459275 [Delitschia confertaspora ATCC 74209]|uniref:Uncharacterized protein n=1 Tax=Delitschia confertaspora ATCC 74209 TaxID=1513339 RepID=A0A9P4JB18_9PLEO|nr:hypothetical protein GQ43DRAFT_459275 [Delitschia confertaspora ATCC 74209]
MVMVSEARKQVPSDDGSGSDLNMDEFNIEKQGLGLGDLIQKFTQTQSQDYSDSDSDLVQPFGRKRRALNDTEEEEEVIITSGNQEQESESDYGFDEDPEAAYKEFQNRKSNKRKATAAETRRIKAANAKTVASRTSIIGRKPQKKPLEHQQKDLRGQYALVETPLEREGGAVSRKRKLSRAHNAGLRYPPYLKDIDWTDSKNTSQLEEKPQLPGHVTPKRLKKDVKMRNSKGVIPAPIAQWLRDYQVEGVKFLHERFVEQRGALLGDDMGLGKTVQVIAFLTAAFHKTGTKLDQIIMRKVRTLEDNRWYPRVLIVCPGSLLQNWQDELDMWGWWHVDVYHGLAREDALEAARTGRTEIMLTTYGMYRRHEGDINTIDWDCIIADECHQIKSKDSETTKAMNKVNALCRIGLTGTAIQNRYEELWTLLNWANPGKYGTAMSWKHDITTPLKVGQSHDATNEQLANARMKARELVEDILPNVFLRRMKSLIADQLPKKVDRVVFCQLTDLQAEAYRNLVDSETFEYIRRAGESCDCGSKKKRGWCCYMEVPGRGKWSKWPFPCMVYLQKLANHLALLLPVSTDNQDKQSNDLETVQTALPDEWKNLYRIRENILKLSQREYCGKWKVLKRLLDFWHKNGDKVLVFSHSVRLLRLLKSLFDVDGMKFNWSYLDGSMTYDARAKAVADFNTDPNQFVFLISTKAGGVGLNITSANKVVVVDPNWNPAYDLQAQDRAYRIGQTRDVEVFRLISSGTIEEIVYARQIYKQQQANIGYTASLERRYFKGVMDEKGKKGELFGLESLFSFEENGLLLRDIIHKTNVAEVRADVKTMDFEVSLDEMYEDEEGDAVLSDKSLGIDADIASQKQMKEFANQLIGKKKRAERKGPDPVNAILAKAGVVYTHENSEVIGRSKVEAELSRKAMEVRNDVDLGKKTAFDLTQSQARHNSLSQDDDDEDDLNGPPEELKINYKYRPNEEIRKRQFGAMAEWAGYEDTTEFALAIEDMTQEERRSLLNKFYRSRRRSLVQEFKRQEQGSA